jgi:hypothetical protein
VFDNYVLNGNRLLLRGLWFLFLRGGSGSGCWSLHLLLSLLLHMHLHLLGRWLLLGGRDRLLERCTLPHGDWLLLWVLFSSHLGVVSFIGHLVLELLLLSLLKRIGLLLCGGLGEVGPGVFLMGATTPSISSESLFGFGWQIPM